MRENQHALAQQGRGGENKLFSS